MPDSKVSSSPIANKISQNIKILKQLDDEVLPKPNRTIVIAIGNQKGGVGKTTTAVNLAASLAMGGYNVVVVDCDPQGNASTALGVNHTVGTTNTYNVMLGESSLLDALVPCSTIPNLWVCPSTLDLAGAEVELVDIPDRHQLIADSLRAYQAEDTDTDVIILDCPPSLGLLTLNSFVASDGVIIPIQAEYYALEGLSMLIENLEKIKNSFAPGLKVFGILLTMVNKRTTLSNEVVADVRRHFGNLVFEAEIPRSIRLSEAPSFQQTILTYDPNGTGAVYYRLAARELAYRLLGEVNHG